MKLTKDDYEKSSLCDELLKILMNHCGEDGDNEGAVETLNRISEKARKWDLLENAKTHEALVEYPQLKKLRELIEKQLKFRQNYEEPIDPDKFCNDILIEELQKLLEESKQ